MLGTIDRQHVQQLLSLLAEGDAPGLMAAVDEIDRQFPDYGRMLDDMARLLQRIAVFQVVGRNENDDELSDEELAAFARDSMPRTCSSSTRSPSWVVAICRWRPIRAAASR